MILAHKESLTNKVIKVNWQLEIGDWIDPLFSLLESEYMDDLVTFINEKYKSTKFIYPKRNRLFKPFQYCKYKDLKVVMISTNCPISEKASGFGFGLNTNDDNENLPPFLNSFKTVIKSNLYSNSTGSVYFDTSLQEFAEQGVLFLNASMTRECNESHEVIWQHFIRETIKTINKEKKGIVFVFLNSDNERFEKYIDTTKNYILRNSGNTLPIYSNLISKIEDIILDKHPQGYIQW